MENLAIRQFEEQLINTTNASPLPIEAKRLVFMNVLRQIERAADETVLKEAAAWQEAQKAAAEEKAEGSEDQQKGE